MGKFEKKKMRKEVWKEKMWEVTSVGEVSKAVQKKCVVVLNSKSKINSKFSKNSKSKKKYQKCYAYVFCQTPVLPKAKQKIYFHQLITT